MDIPEDARWFDGREVLIFKVNKLLKKIPGGNHFLNLGTFWEIPGMTHAKWIKLIDSECKGGMSKNQPPSRRGRSWMNLTSL